MSSVEQIRGTVQRNLEKLLADCDVIDASLAVTSDGHLVAKAERGEYALNRLAAMGSTLMALGDTITRELNMGKCRNIISENEQGIVLFMHITRNIVLVSMSSSTSALGMLLSANRRCVENTVEDLRSLKKTSTE